MSRMTTGGGRWLPAAVVGLVLSAAPVLAQPQATQESSGRQEQMRDQDRLQQRAQAGQQVWSRDAEQTFGLGRGLGPRLMTREEWQEHQRRMRQMTPEERERYRAEVHARLQRRAREEGLTPPEAPRGPASGMGPGGGMGSGGGMGPGGGMGSGGGMGPGGGMGSGGGMGPGGRR